MSAAKKRKKQSTESSGREVEVRRNLFNHEHELEDNISGYFSPLSSGIEEHMDKVNKD